MRKLKLLCRFVKRLTLSLLFFLAFLVAGLLLLSVVPIWLVVLLFVPEERLLDLLGSAFNKVFNLWTRSSDALRGVNPRPTQRLNRWNALQEQEDELSVLGEILIEGELALARENLMEEKLTSVSAALKKLEECLLEQEREAYGLRNEVTNQHKASTLRILSSKLDTNLEEAQKLMCEWKEALSDLTSSESIIRNEMTKLQDDLEKLTKNIKINPKAKEELQAKFDAKSKEHKEIAAKVFARTGVASYLEETWRFRLDSANLKETTTLIRKQEEKNSQDRKAETRLRDEVDKLRLNLEKLTKDVEQNPKARAELEEAEAQFHIKSKEYVRISARIKACSEALYFLELRESQISTNDHIAHDEPTADLRENSVEGANQQRSLGYAS